MVEIPISQLPQATQANPGDLIPATQIDGITRRLTVAQIQADGLPSEPLGTLYGGSGAPGVAAPVTVQGAGGITVTFANGVLTITGGGIAPTVTNALLLEGGGALLLEGGGPLLLESSGA
jgi:hypothetical protein